jgi:hypothetical protein
MMDGIRKGHASGSLDRRPTRRGSAAQSTASVPEEGSAALLEFGFGGLQHVR